MSKVHLIGIFFVVSLFVTSALHAETQGRAEDGQPPQRIYGTYSTTYYADYNDWQVFPVLLPIINRNGSLPYNQRFDLSTVGQIRGELEGGVKEGAYRIDLPDHPVGSAWFDTDGDPGTPSNVKLFLVGTASGIIGTDHISRYDFAYTRSFVFDPNTRLWSGSLLVWTDAADAAFPLLNGEDERFYTPDDVMVSVPLGWSVVEVKAKAALGIESVRVFRTSEPFIDLREAPQFEDVDLSSLSYPDAFDQLMNELERTYIFTDYRQVDWDALREKYTPKVAQISDVYQFQQLLESALFSFRDGHLAIVGPGLPDWLWGKIGMQVYPVDGELMVVDTDSNSPVGRSPITPGTVITRVNGGDAILYFENVPNIIYSGGHESEMDWFRGDLAFRAQVGTVFELDYRLPNGEEGSISLEADALNEISDDSASPPIGPLTFKILDGGVGLINIHNFTSAYLDDRWDDAMRMMLDEGVTGIIIDLRSNAGGFSAISNYMLGDFLDEDVYSGRQVSSLDEDGDGQNDVKEEFYYARGRIFDPSKVIVLVGPNCFSACEFAAQGFQDIGARVIGHLTSGGAGGGVGASYFLPDNTQVYGMAVVRSENPQGEIRVEGIGVRLDVQVPYTPDGLASGEDLVLHAAEALLLSN